MHSACSGIFFAVVFYLPIAVVCLLVGLPLLPLLAWVRWRRRRHRPHRSPSSIRVAIIGGGWSGLQLAARFQELGVAWEGFEADDDFGGTWHPRRRYAGLSLHTAIWLASFAGFPYSDDPEELSSRPSGAAVHAYLCRFAAHHGLRRGFHFNCRVVRMSADSKARTAILTVVSGDGEQPSRTTTHGPFDLVIYASIAAMPHTPRLRNAHSFEAAGGEQLHASQCTEATIERLVAQRSRVAVVGGSKSAADIVLAMRERIGADRTEVHGGAVASGAAASGAAPGAYEGAGGAAAGDAAGDDAAGRDSAQICWIYRRPYVFFK